MTPDIARPAQPVLSPAERIRRWAGWSECMVEPDPTRDIAVWFDVPGTPGRGLHVLIRERGIEEMWAAKLSLLMGHGGQIRTMVQNWADFAMATAAQRSKALLLVIGEAR